MRTITEKILLGCLLLVCGAPLAAAQASNSGTPAASADAQASSDAKTSAGPNNDFFGQTLAGHWVFTTEFSFDQEYDDNVFTQPVIRLSDNVSRISARFSASVQKKKLRMQVHYYPNYVKYSKYSDRDALSNQYMQEVSYRFSAHTDLTWTLSAARAPGYTNSPFTLFDFDGVVLPVFRPDALESNATILNTNTNINLHHQFTAKDSLTVSLDGNYIQFSSSNGVPLLGLNTKSFSNGATVRWDNEFVPHRKIGLEAGDEYFGFLGPSSHSHYEFVKVRYSQTFGHGYQLSIGAGPGRRDNQSLTGPGPRTSSLDYAVDASFVKAGPRGSVGLSYNHGSQLGLTQGSLASDTMSVTAMKHIGRKWGLNGGFTYSKNTTETAAFVGDTSAYAANGQIFYQFTRDFDLNAGYSYVLQDLSQPFLGASNFDRNVYRFGFRYTFQRITSR